MGGGTASARAHPWETHIREPEVPGLGSNLDFPIVGSDTSIKSSL